MVVGFVTVAVVVMIWVVGEAEMAGEEGEEVVGEGVITETADATHPTSAQTNPAIQHPPPTFAGHAVAPLAHAPTVTPQF